MLGFIPHVEAGCGQPNCKLLFSQQTQLMADLEGKGLQLGCTDP